MPNALIEEINRRSLRERLQLGRTWRLVWQSAPLWTAINGVFVLVEGLLPLLSLYLLKRIVDAFAAAMGEGATRDDFRAAGWFIAALAGVSAIAALFKACGRLVQEAHAAAVTDHVQDIIQTKSVEVDLQDYESPEYHDLLQQVQTQATFRPARIARGVFVGARSLITGLALAALLFSFSWQIGVILVLFAIPGTLVRLTYAHRIVDWYGRHSARQRVSGYYHSLLSGSAFAKEVRLFGLGDVLRTRARHLRGELRSERIRLESRRAWIELIPHLSSVAALFLSFWLVARQAIAGQITIGAIVIYYQAFQRCQSALSDFLNTMVHFYEDSLFLSVFYRFLDLRSRLTAPSSPRHPPRTVQTGLAIHNLHFRYPGTDRDVLSDVSLVIRPGETVALVGENGAGKTTLAKLIGRLYDPDAGVITLDGTDIREFDVAGYRRLIGAVFQDFNQFNLTVRENIGFGDVTVPENDPRILEAARRAGIHDVIEKLPKGYDTILGREFRAGAQLSAGQWQRVALARALLRDAPVLILDEPTSAMDPKAEHEMYLAMHAMTAGRATLLISHRLSTVTMADRICVLDHGRIVESGTHAELQSRGGLYADLFDRQSRAYRDPACCHSGFELGDIARGQKIVELFDIRLTTYQSASDFRPPRCDT